MSVRDLPALNAALNGLCALLLVSGWWCIRNRHRVAHRRFMLTACVVSVMFLASYVTYHAHAGSTPFPRAKYPIAAWVYFAILIPHTLLAAINVPLVIVTLIHAVRGHLDRHRRIARWTLGVWIYVSVTGVLIYAMLYQWFLP